VVVFIPISTTCYFKILKMLTVKEIDQAILTLRKARELVNPTIAKPIKPTRKELVAEKSLQRRIKSEANEK